MQFSGFQRYIAQIRRDLPNAKTGPSAPASSMTKGQTRGAQRPAYILSRFRGAALMISSTRSNNCEMLASLLIYGTRVNLLPPPRSQKTRPPA
jgi:hypothetical protein